MEVWHWVLVLVPVSPLFLFFADGYFHKDFRQALILIVVFIGLGLVCFYTIRWLTIWAAIVIPLFLLLAIALRHLTR